MAVRASSGPGVRAGAALYQHLSPGERYIHVARDRAVLELLQRTGFSALSRQRILELGCGEGSFLSTLLHYGASPNTLNGLDLDAHRISRAGESLAGVRLSVADISSLPCRDETFDLVFAFTVFSSVLDDAKRQSGAREALRVLRPGGLLVIYDFFTNPTNRAVRPLRLTELRRLFAPREVLVERVTLAPPIARALGGREGLCAPLAWIPLLRTHLLASVLREG